MKINKKILISLIIFTAGILITGVMSFIIRNNTEITRESLQREFEKAVRPSDIFEAVLLVENSNGSFSENFGYGRRNIDTPMLTASVGKLFTTACILMLNEEGRLSLDDKLTKYFNSDQLKGLHIYKGREYSFDLTISDLLFQTSGLPNTSRTLADEDAFFTFDQKITSVKSITPHFAPNTGKAYYANINFFILGEILEKITAMPLSAVYEKMIFSPLGMTNTYLPANENDFIPHFYDGKEKTNRPKNIISAGAAGGFVSTPKDLMTFSKAFWQGKLFEKSVFEKLAVYKKLEPYFGPAYYGGGHMRISSEGIYKLLMGKGDLIGHSGVTGSFAFYYPEKDLYFIGDFSQLKKPSAPYLMLMKLSKMAD